MKKIFLYLFLISSFTASTQDFSVEITPWQGGKSGAVSVSFDDASYTQYKYAFPVLEKYGLKASFGLVGEWTKEEPAYSAEPGMFRVKKMGWEQIRELSGNGYEIAAHGYRHIRYGKYLPVDTLVQQMKRVKLLIESHIDKTVYTMHYPYSFTSDSIVKATQKAGFVLGRTEGQEDYNTYENFNPYLLVSKAILNDTIPNVQEFQKILQQAKGKWLILMYHHLFPEDSKEIRILKHHKVLHTYSVAPPAFDKQMKLVNNSSYWVDTEANIGRYILERKHTKLRYRKFCKTLKIKTKIDLDAEVYNMPLTLSMKIPWQKVSVKGSLHDGVYKLINGRLLIDVLPGNTVKIKKIK